MNRFYSLPSCLLCMVIAGSIVVAQETDQRQVPEGAKTKLVPGAVDGARNVHVAGNVMLAGQPSQEGFEALADQGYTTVITLRHKAEERFDQEEVCKRLGMKFVRLTISAPNDLDRKLIEDCSKMLSSARADSRVLLHCASANRVGAVWLAHRVKADDLTIQEASAEARKVGLRTKELEAKAIEYLNGK